MTTRKPNGKLQAWNLRGRKLTVGLVALTMASWASLAGTLEDLVVAAGETRTLSSDCTYRTITVNGTLTIDSGATVTIDDPDNWNFGILKVGDGLGAAGRLVLRDGAKLISPDKDGSYFYFGLNGGHADVEMSGEGTLLRCWRARFAYGRTADKPSSTAVRLADKARLYAVNSLAFADQEYGVPACPLDNDKAAAEVTLESESLLEGWRLSKGNDVRCDIHFRGGRLEAQCLGRSGDGDLVLDGTPEFPIRLHLRSSFDAANETYWDNITYYFKKSGGAGKFRLVGDCDFVKGGHGKMDQVLVEAAEADCLEMTYAGTTRVEEGGFALAAPSPFPPASDMVLGKGCNIDLRGNELRVGSLLGTGEVVDSGETPGMIRFTAPEGVSAVCECAHLPVVRLAKSGEGTLEIVRDSFAGISVEAGTLRLQNRKDVGYDQYRFKVDSAYGNTFDGMHIAELRLYNAEKDVTRPYLRLDHASGNAPALVDGVWDNDYAKWWYDCHHESQPDFGEAYVDILYDENLPVSGYTWISAGDTSPSADNCRDPGSWRLFGRESGGTWHELSRVGFREYTLPGRRAESKVFDLAYPNVITGGDVTVAKGATLALAEGVALSCASYDCRGVLESGKNARLAVGDAADVTIAYPGFDGGAAFEKIGAGTVTVLGALGGIRSLAVSGGTLKPQPGCDAPWLNYKFVLEARSDGEAYQFGELALYGRTGERVNLMANLASFKADGNVGENLFDDDLETCNWCNSDILNVEFTLKAADSVAGYLYAPTSQYNNWFKAPSQWKVYARQSDADDWTLLDARAEACDPAYDKTWYGYNRGVPYFFTAVRDTTRPAFDPTVVVSVAAGASLDLTKTATTLAALQVDVASAGAIKGGSLSAVGTLDVVASESLSGEVLLPLALDGTAMPANLSGWTVTLNGSPSKCRLGVRGGRLLLIPSGLAVLLR